MGLHRRDSLLTQFRDQQQQIWVNKLFWCIYVLDRRWSLGVGMPFALHDLDIDPDLPRPVRTSSSSYLRGLILTQCTGQITSISHIIGRLWQHRVDGMESNVWVLQLQSSNKERKGCLLGFQRPAVAAISSSRTTNTIKWGRCVQWPLSNQQSIKSDAIFTSQSDEDPNPQKNSFNPDHNHR